MHFLYEYPIIDLVEFGRRNRRHVTRKSFAKHIVLLADQTIRSGTPEAQLLGIRSCLCHQLYELKWGAIPLFSETGQRFVDTTFALSKRDLILPNYIIATTLFYRNSLDDRSTGLRKIIFSEFVQGLEWACSEAIYKADVEKEYDVPKISAVRISI